MLPTDVPQHTKSVCPVMNPSARSGAGTGRDAADRIMAVLDDRSGRLRHSLDETGREVFRVLGLESESARDAIVRNASGLAWWFE